MRQEENRFSSFFLWHYKTHIIQVCRILKIFTWSVTAAMPETRIDAGPVIPGVIHCSRLQPFFQKLLFLKAASDSPPRAQAVAVSVR